MNNFNRVCPTGNSLAAGDPAGEYANRHRSDPDADREKCRGCGELFEKDKLVDGACRLCWNEEMKEQE